MKRSIRRTCAGAGAVVAVIVLFGCDSGCDDETVDRAIRFLKSHQSCEHDPDCVIVRDFCELPNGFCGQLTMNRLGQQTAEWQEIEEELSECASDCVTCDAARIPTCINGACNGTLN